MKTKSLELGKGLKKAVAALGFSAAKATANSTCVFISHQPKMPKGAEKLRKF